MAINRQFTKTSGGAVASYNWTDIADGTGYVTFYGGLINTDYVLSPNAFYSDDVGTKVQSNPQTATKLIEKDFDLTPFVIPKILDGYAFFNIPFGIDNTGGSSDTFDVYFVVRVIKYDGSTEDELVNSTGATLRAVVAGSNVADVAIVKADIPKTLFKKGDLLRITVEMWGVHTNASSPYWYMGHDPKGRLTKQFGVGAVANITFPSGKNTIFSIDIPFGIEL